MLTTYRFRLYPTLLQSRKMEETTETCRRLYNELLASRMENRTAGLAEQDRQITQMRKGNKFLKAVQSHVLQDVAARLDKAYGAFFAGLARYPKFRRRGKYHTFSFDYTGFTVHRGFVRLSMIGDVRLRLRWRSGLP